MVLCKTTLVLHKSLRLNIPIKCIHIRHIHTDCMSIYNTAAERSETISDADIWNKMSKHKHTIESTIGKDAMFAAIKTDNKRPKTG